MPLIQANGITFNTLALGSGPPVVMLHGLVIGNLASWYFSAAPILAPSNKLFLYDLRGHGKSQRILSGYDLQTMQKDLQALVDVFSQEPVSLVGHSYGGLVALGYAARNPERVKKLALVDVTFSPSTIVTDNESEDKTEEDLLNVLPKPMRQAVERGGRRARRFIESLEFLLADSQLVEDLRREPDIPDEQLHNLRCPVLGIFGQSSFYLNQKDHLARHVPKSQIEVVPGGHNLHVEQAQDVASILKEFLHG